jgi:hypothetical protein
MWTKGNDHAPWVNVLIILIYAQTYSFEREKYIQVWPFSCLLFPKNISLKFYYYSISLSWALAFFYESISFAFPFENLLDCWTMLVDNVGLQICLFEISNSMVTVTFFPWCKLKWYWDEFNNQSHILHGLGTTSWSMV